MYTPDPPVRDFLEELCSIIRSADSEAQTLEDDSSAIFPSEADQCTLAKLLADPAARAVCLRLVRHGATAAIFHTLVLFDERKELGASGAEPRLTLRVGDADVTPPNFLHELLGDAMIDLGMDPSDWW